MRRLVIALGALLAVLGAGGSILGGGAVPAVPAFHVSNSGTGPGSGDWRTFGPAPIGALPPGEGGPATSGPPSSSAPASGSAAAAQSLNPSGFRQIACWAHQAGWAPADIPVADAIVWPESGGNPRIVQQDQPYATTGWGLWQITPGNSYPDLGINDALLNPVTNARAALRKFSTQGWGAWTTYTGGEYLRYLPTVEAALAGFDYATCGG